MDPQPNRDSPQADSSPQLLGSAPTRRTSRFAGLAVTAPRLLVVGGVVVLVVLGCLLPFGWLPIALAGGLILVSTFRAHGRIDSYASI